MVWPSFHNVSCTLLFSESTFPQRLFFCLLTRDQSVIVSIRSPLSFPSEAVGICLQPALQSVDLFFLSCVWGTDRVRWRGQLISCLIKDCGLASVLSRASKAGSSVSLENRPTGQGRSVFKHCIWLHFSEACYGIQIWGQTRWIHIFSRLMLQTSVHNLLPLSSMLCFGIYKVASQQHTFLKHLLYVYGI